ncbi:MAG: hypothetical protein LAT84_13795 [Balneolia bacterium]|nr:hypothetical protein [Balneolia bacterium]
MSIKIELGKKHKNDSFGGLGSMLSIRDIRNIDVSSLPAEHVVKGQRFGGWFMMIFALVWGGVPTFIFLLELSSGDMEPMMYLLLLFGLIGIGLFLGGLNTAITNEVIKIDNNTVSFNKKTLFNHTVWTEPKSRYKGVRAWTEHRSGGKNQSSYTMYFVELYHDDKKKRVLLFESRAPKDFRATFEKFSRDLNLPALEGHGDELIARDASDLDKSVRELAAEGKIDVDFDPSRRPPEGVEASMQDGKLRIKLPPAPIDPVASGVGLFFVIILTGAGLFADEAPRFLVVVAAGIFMFLLSMIIYNYKAPKIVAIGRDRVLYYREAPWGDTAGDYIKTDEIESVYVGKEHENQGRKGVMLVSDKKRIKLGEGLPDETLNWLRSCVLGIITR